MSAVGLIVNPVAGRDIRRLVGRASLVPHHEKAAIVRRVLQGLGATGVETVLFLADPVGIVAAAVDGTRPPLAMEPLPYRADGSASDSTEAARQLVRAGVGAIITLGGDGTNRAVAAACGDVPLVAISTGTNNVFPSMVEGTVAGMAAGLVATESVPLEQVVHRTKRIEARCERVHDFALIDAAACTDPFAGSRAIWDLGRVKSLVLSRAEPWAVGLSSIGGRLRPITADEPAGLYLELGSGPAVLATLMPGVVARVGVSCYRVLQLDEEVGLEVGAGTLALDGERELAVDGAAWVRVTANGPRLVDVRAALAAASPGAETWPSS